MNDRAFVDTNVLVYAHDLDAGARHAIAARLVAELWETRRAVISTQVLQEFYVNATRKIPSPLPRPTARQIVKTYAVWQTELVGPPRSNWPRSSKRSATARAVRRTGAVHSFCGQ